MSYKDDAGSARRASAAGGKDTSRLPTAAHRFECTAALLALLAWWAGAVSLRSAFEDGGMGVSTLVALTCVFVVSTIVKFGRVWRAPTGAWPVCWVLGLIDCALRRRGRDKQWPHTRRSPERYRRFDAT